MIKKLFLVLFVIIILSGVALAVPQYINFQGILRDTTGNTLTGTYAMIFKLYDVVTGGTAVYNAAGTSQNVSVSNGIYNVRLGPIDATTLDGADKWLETTVGSDVLAPRIRVNSVAYAIRADVADSVSDEAISTAKIQDNAVTAAKIDSGIDFSTAGSVTAQDVTVNGKLNASSSVIGTATISDGEGTSKTISDTSVSSSSTVFICDSGSTYDFGRVWASGIINNQFTLNVQTGPSGLGQSANFNYIIIN